MQYGTSTIPHRLLNRFGSSTNDVPNAREEILEYVHAEGALCGNDLDPSRNRQIGRRLGGKHYGIDFLFSLHKVRCRLSIPSFQSRIVALFAKPSAWTNAAHDANFTAAACTLFHNYYPHHFLPKRPWSTSTQQRNKSFETLERKYQIKRSRGQGS
jgi:hypothetical protein